MSMVRQAERTTLRQGQGMPTYRCSRNRIARACYANGIHTVCDTISAETCWLRGQTCKSMCMPIERECRAFCEGDGLAALCNGSNGISTSANCYRIHVTIERLVCGKVVSLRLIQAGSVSLSKVARKALM